MQEGAKSKKERKGKSHRKEKKEAIEEKEEGELEMDEEEGVVFPEHLSRVNYLAMDAFSCSLDDDATHKAYADAMLENRYLFEGKTVLHLTEGINCLFSFFAVEAGCKKVFCVINGQSERELQNIYMIRQIVKENDKEDLIEVPQLEGLQRDGRHHHRGTDGLLSALRRHARPHHRGPGICSWPRRDSSSQTVSTSSVQSFTTSSSTITKCSSGTMSTASP